MTNAESTPPRARRNIVAGTVGGALDWYDFAVYGYLAPINEDVRRPGSDR